MSNTLFNTKEVQNNNKQDYFIVTDYLRKDGKTKKTIIEEYIIYNASN